MHFTTILAFAIPLLAAAVPAALPDGPEDFAAKPNPSDIQIASITYGGNGCPAGSVGSALSDDRTTLTLLFDKYIAQSGPSLTAADQRRSCQLNLKLRYPNGYQYSIFTADFRGYAYIAKRSVGTCKSTYYFSGSQTQVCHHGDHCSRPISYQDLQC
jgi:hypothetical protein